MMPRCIACGSEIERYEPEDKNRSAAMITWHDRLEPIAAVPGVWHTVRKMGSKGSAAATATRLRNGRLLIPEGEWEFGTSGANVLARKIR